MADEAPQNELVALFKTFKPTLRTVAVFSAVINILMLTPAI